MVVSRNTKARMAKQQEWQKNPVRKLNEKYPKLDITDKAEGET